MSKECKGAGGPYIASGLTTVRWVAKILSWFECSTEPVSAEHCSGHWYLQICIVHWKWTSMESGNLKAWKWAYDSTEALAPKCLILINFDISLERVTQPRWSTSWTGARLPSWAIQFRTNMSNLESSSLIASTMVMVWPILTRPDTSDAQGPLPTCICIQQPTLSPAKSARTTSSMSTGKGRNVTDFSYWSCQVHLSFLAWSHTSCTCGSYWMTMMFSKYVPEPESRPYPYSPFSVLPVVPHARTFMSNVADERPSPAGIWTQWLLPKCPLLKTTPKNGLLKPTNTFMEFFSHLTSRLIIFGTSAVDTGQVSSPNLSFASCTFFWKGPGVWGNEIPLYTAGGWWWATDGFP